MRRILGQKGTNFSLIAVFLVDEGYQSPRSNLQHHESQSAKDKSLEILTGGKPQSM
jgi:hypothetical protein